MHVSAIGSQALESEIAVRLAVAMRVSSGLHNIWPPNSIFIYISTQDSETDAQIDSWRGERIEWCLDHGFEYVEINCDDIVQGIHRPARGSLREHIAVSRNKLID